MTSQPGGGHDRARGAVHAAAAPITGAVSSFWSLLLLDLARLAARWPLDPPAVRRRRVTLLEDATGARLADLHAALTGLVPPAVRDVYQDAAVTSAALAGVGVAFGRGDARALEQLTNDLWQDLLAALHMVAATVAQVTRPLYRAAVGEPGAGDALIRAAVDDLGIAGAVYVDGSRHALPEYARMATRTQLAQTWQMASLRVYSVAGVEWVEVTDGIGCGWTSHTDPDKANGKIVTVDEAMTWLIAHPNCQRRTFPRRDITSAEDARAASPASSAQVGDGGDVLPPVDRGTAGRFQIGASLVAPAAARRQAIADRVDARRQAAEAEGGG